MYHSQIVVKEKALDQYDNYTKLIRTLYEKAENQLSQNKELINRIVSLKTEISDLQSQRTEFNANEIDAVICDKQRYVARLEKSAGMLKYYNILSQISVYNSKLERVNDTICDNCFNDKKELSYSL